MRNLPCQILTSAITVRSLLQSSALNTISGLMPTAANYREAVSVLGKHFGYWHQIVAKDMDILLSIDPVASSSNFKRLRHLYDTVEMQVRGLKSLGVPADSYRSLLSSVLLNKLPHIQKPIIISVVEQVAPQTATNTQ